ncbi:cell wall-binding repeat-containing protein [Dehalobacter restrictus]|nr:cell wall-binding repeat-containing protein [Dehalobacter restrictus]
MKRSIRLSILISLTVFLCLGFMIPSAHAAETKRLSGDNRYSTASAIALDGWKQSDYVILANGQNYPDALSAAPLAKKYDAPILLTSGISLPDITKKTLITLQTKNVIIIGGIGVIPVSIEQELKAMNISVTRIAGQDRYDTTVKIAEQLGSSSEIIVATGEDYPDALSAGPIAAIKQIPIILVPQDYMPDSIKTYIQAQNITKTYVIGGTEIISDSVANQFPGVERNKGTDKYARNINVTLEYDDIFTGNDICVATGENFADALTGVAYAAKKGIPIILISEYPGLVTRVYTVLKLNMEDQTNGIPYIFGGTSIVSNKAISYLYTLPDTSQASKPSTPTDLVATAISSSEIALQWNQVNNADYYYIYTSNDGSDFRYFINEDGSHIKYNWTSGYSFKLYEISPNTTVYFKVTAVKDGVESDFSNVVSATTLSNSVVTTPITPVLTTPDVVESRIDGKFTGWTGDTLFKLQNGQIWQQSSYAYTYHYAYAPEVTIYKSGSVYKMKVDGVDQTINVVRLK